MKGNSRVLSAAAVIIYFIGIAAAGMFMFFFRAMPSMASADGVAQYPSTVEFIAGFAPLFIPYLAAFILFFLIRIKFKHLVNIFNIAVIVMVVLPGINFAFTALTNFSLSIWEVLILQLFIPVLIFFLLKRKIAHN